MSIPTSSDAMRLCGWQACSTLVNPSSSVCGQHSFRGAQCYTLTADSVSSAWQGHAQACNSRARVLPWNTCRDAYSAWPQRTVVWVQDQYPAHQIQAHVPQHGPRYEHKNVPFEGTTTNQDAYKAYAVEPHRAMHAPVVAKPYTKFEGTCTCTIAPA